MYCSIICTTFFSLLLKYLSTSEIKQYFRLGKFDLPGQTIKLDHLKQLQTPFTVLFH